MSKQASDYPITFAYGMTDGVYYASTKAQSASPALWIGPYHRGDDRYMPEGTAVLVNGQQIGRSGSTGAASGPHLHLGRFVNGAATNPNGQGFQLEEATVLETGYDSVNGHYVKLLDVYGAVWVYLHLLEITVVTGQHLAASEGDLSMATADELWEALNNSNKRIDAANADKDRLWTALDATNKKIDAIASLLTEMATKQKIDRSHITDAFVAVDNANKRIDAIKKTVTPSNQ